MDTTLMTVVNAILGLGSVSLVVAMSIWGMRPTAEEDRIVSPPARAKLAA